MFQPDILNEAALPRNARRTATPERRLLVAILADAIDCYQHNLDARTARKRRLCREAEQWMLSDDQEWAFSFRNICDALGIDADALRARTRAWKAHQAARTRAGQRTEAAVQYWEPTPLNERSRCVV
jgi:hypothetical protein